jgi:hypothetical protein
MVQGAPGQALTAEDMQCIEAFLSAANARVRALGGTRFNGASQPSPEWQPFGSFYFVIPRLEMLEAAACCLLSCTLAWKPELGPQDRYGLCTSLMPSPHFAKQLCRAAAFVSSSRLS